MSNEAEKDEFYKKDPKKYLKDFFEREGLEMYFDTNQLACEFVYLFVYLLLLLCYCCLQVGRIELDLQFG